MSEIQSNHTARIRVLLIAEAANPEWVSVPLVGWSHSQALSQLADVHLVTQIRNREAILRAKHRPKQLTYINSEILARRLWQLSRMLRGGKGKGWTTVTALNALSYSYFERLVWKRFSQRIHDGEFDLVHRLTPLSPTIPSALAQKCRKARVPFVLGPLNGGVPWPRPFDAARRREREWLSYVRRTHALLPGFRATRKHATAIIIGSRDTWNQMPPCYHDKSVYIPENAIDPERFTAQRTRQFDRPLRAVFLGRLVPYKGADMLVEAAVPLIRENLMTLTIIGDGPQRPQLQAIADSHRLGNGFNLTGWIDHSDVQHRLAEHDVFAFPSIREFGGGAALEAMAVGLVPIVVNYGGVGELVSPASGYRISIGCRDHIVRSFRETLRRLALRPLELAEKAAAARERATTQFTWPTKALQTYQVYRWALGLRETKPDFGMPFPDVSRSRRHRTAEGSGAHAHAGSL